jgi:hypothetical protein
VEVGLRAQNAIEVFRAPHGINFNTLLLYIFPVINDRYLLGITGNVFLKITCVKESGVGFMPMQRRHLNSLELQKRDKDAQCTELVEWGRGEGGSKDNYKG